MRNRRKINLGCNFGERETMKNMVKTCLLLLIFIGQSWVVAAQTQTFTYQGSLKSGGSAAYGSYDFQFAIYSAQTGGVLLTTITRNNVNVGNGVFTVELDATTAIFDGDPKYLEIKVKQAGGSTYETLSPRQLITSSPYAIKSVLAEDAVNASVAVFAQTANNADNLGGIAANNYLQKNGDGSQLTNLNGSSITNGSIDRNKLAFEPTNRFDPQLLAMQRWDLLPIAKTVSVGNAPLAMIFDGTFIYVANRGDATVTRIRSKTGEIEGNPIPVGQFPSALVYDGTFVYVANRSSNTVSRIRGSTGTVEGEPIPVGTSPRALCFDGIFVNVSTQNSVMRIRASTGTVDAAQIPIPNVSAMAFDGTFVYTTGQAVDLPTSDEIRRFRASTGLTDDAFTFVAGQGISSMVFDGTFIYCGSNTSGIQKVRVNPREIFPRMTAINAFSMVFDGIFVYAASLTGSNNNVVKIRASNGVVEGNPIPVGAHPDSMIFDGTFIWINDRDNNSVRRIELR